MNDVEQYFSKQEKNQKIKKIIIYISFILFLGIIVFAFKTLSPSEIKSISLDSKELKMRPGESQIVTATIYPKNASYNTIIWESSNPDVVEVDTTGNIKVISEGEGDVTVTVSNLDRTISSKLIVKLSKEEYVPVEKIEVNNKNLNLSYGDSTNITTQVYPPTASDKKVIWTSSNPDIVKVTEDGKVSTVSNKSGEVKITASTEDGEVKTEVVVKVDKKEENKIINVTGIKLNKNKLELTNNKSETITVTISPSNATNKNVEWSSSNESLVKVDQNGKITAVKNEDGKTIITATTIDGKKTAQVEVTVKKIDETIKVTGVKINTPSKKTLYLNKTGNNYINMSATVSPENATNKNITWESSNESVATISKDGKITPKALGQTKITVKTEDGSFSASYTIKVKQKNILVITASQGVRMYNYFKKYTSNNNSYKYSIEDDTLKYIYKSGSGFEFQYGEGLELGKEYLKKNFKDKKDYVEISLFFTMTGNTVKSFTCSKIKTDDEYLNIASKYNKAIQEIKDLGYNVNGYLITHSPLNTKHPLAKEKKIVYSHSDNACKSGYRSAWKYYLSNNRIKSVLETNNYPNIKLVDNWSNFLAIKSEKDRTFTWLNKFTTPDDDALHWDEPTTILYMQLAFDTAGM